MNSSLNSISAAGSYSEPLVDENFPAYFFQYTTSFLDNYGHIDTSFIGLLPSNRKNERVLSVECAGELYYIPLLDGRVKAWTIVFDVLNITVFSTFVLEYGLEGTLTIPSLQSPVVNASLYITYTFDIENGKLYFIIDLNKIPTLPPTGNIPFSFNVVIQDDVISTRYVRQAYALQNFPYQYTGAGQTILVPSYLESGYLLSDIQHYLLLQGITKSEAQLASQISYVNVTTFTTFFWNGNYYRIPASDGYFCDPPLTQLAMASADELVCNLEYILSIAPDANILIAYFGCNCDPNTGTSTSRVVAEMQLINWMETNRTRFDIVCDVFDHLPIDAYNDIQLDSFLSCFSTLIDNHKTLVTSSGDLGIVEPDLYSLGESVLSVGGSMIVTTTEGTNKQVCYPSSSGGFYDMIPGELMPDYQVGVVRYPDARPVNLPTTNLIGVPSTCGIASGLSYIMNGVLIPREGNNCAPSGLSALFALINQATGTTWRYLDILYYEYEYVCNYIDEGNSQAWRASDYIDWNPITGLGWVDGTKLLNMLNPPILQTGDSICICNTYLQTKMAFLNFFPPTGLYEEAIRQPVFGMQSYWSYLKIYRILPGTNQLDLGNTRIQDGDTVVMFSAIPQLHWVMSWDATGFVRLLKYQNVITDNMKWKITMESTTNDFYENVRFNIFTDDTVFLSCRSGATSPSSSPSLYDRIDETTQFIFRRHSWFIANPTLYTTILKLDYCYYMNVSNANFYIASDYNISNYMQGRQLAASFDLICEYQPFQQYPQLLVIPLRGVLNPIPRDGQSFALFDTLIQAFVRVPFIYTSGTAACTYVNINYSTSDAKVYFFDQCAFYFEKMINAYEVNLFTPTLSISGSSPTTSSVAKYNSFFTKVSIYNLGTYFKHPILTFGLSANGRGPVQIIVGRDQTNPLFLFHNDPENMLSKPESERIWIRQILYPFQIYQNDAIYPGGQSGIVNLPYIGPYNSASISKGSAVGSWRMVNAIGSNSVLRDEDGDNKYWYITYDKAFVFLSNFESGNSFLANVANTSTWQPQMFSYDGIDTVGHWRLIPQLGPLENYLFSGFNYDFVSVRTGKYLSTVMGLSHTPSMFTNPSPALLRPPVFLSIYIPKNDL